MLRPCAESHHRDRKDVQVWNVQYLIELPQSRRSISILGKELNRCFACVSRYANCDTSYCGRSLQNCDAHLCTSAAADEHRQLHSKGGVILRVLRRSSSPFGLRPTQQVTKNAFKLQRF